jgi:hypothetical protein
MYVYNYIVYRSPSVTSCPCLPVDNRFRYNARQINVNEPSASTGVSFGLCSLPNIVPTVLHTRVPPGLGWTSQDRQHPLDMRTIDLISMISKCATHSERRQVSKLYDIQ